MQVKVEYEAVLCGECYFDALGGVRDDDDPGANERGTAFASLLPVGADVSDVRDFDEPGYGEPYFSWGRCDGCDTGLGGDRYDVRVTEWAD